MIRRWLDLFFFFFFHDDRYGPKLWDSGDGSLHPPENGSSGKARDV
jgi:hypothetical protein